MKHFKLLSVATVVLLLGMLFVAPASTTHADSEDLTVDTGCDPEALPSYTGTLELESKSFDIYVRLSKRGEQAQVRGYVQAAGEYGTCQKLGELTASGDRWTKLGEYTVPITAEYVMELASPALDKLPDANRPALMLVPRDRPICVPDMECEVTIDSQKGYVRPTGTLLSEDSLHVLQVMDPAASLVKTVRYYVDDKLIYTKPVLETFDLRYVSYPKQKLTRAIEYSSGQQVILPGEAPSDHVDTLANVMFRLGKAYPRLVVTLLVIVLIVLSALAVLAVARAIWHHRNWEYNHGILHKQEHELTPRERELIVKRERVRSLTRMTLLGAGILVASSTFVIIANTYLAQIFSVDGRSMRQTLFTGDRMLINKIPKTLAAANSREFIPARGDVVVARAVFGTSSLSTPESDNFFIIKRVIGLPGERIVIKDGVLTIYNKDNPEGFNPDQGSEWESSYVPNDKSEQLDLQLTQSELFLTGDNRPESVDSRFNGALATKEIIGKSAFKLWPLIGHSDAGDR